jgi:hypothetical protein
MEGKRNTFDVVLLLAVEHHPHDGAACNCSIAACNCSIGRSLHILLIGLPIGVGDVVVLVVGVVVFAVAAGEAVVTVLLLAILVVYAAVVAPALLVAVVAKALRARRKGRPGQGRLLSSREKVVYKSTHASTESNHSQLHASASTCTQH